MEDSQSPYFDYIVWCWNGFFPQQVCCLQHVSYFACLFHQLKIPQSFEEPRGLHFDVVHQQVSYFFRSFQ
uniref:Uncharacterized protein n=1 Tax=Octopus bimaculoides TaxID=37653 RepID=A0A0L8FYI3_OCTBM